MESDELETIREEDRTMRIDIIIPTRGTMRVELTLYLISVLQSEHRYQLHLGFMDTHPIAHSRNLIVKKFLESSGSFLWMNDDDVVPQGNVLDLISCDLDVVGLSCPVFRNDQVSWTAGQPTGAFVETDSVGAGCLLISRRVLETVKTPFLEMWKPDGTLELGEDLAFCRRTQAAGFKIWRAPFGAAHFRTVELATVGGLRGNIIS